MVERLDVVHWRTVLIIVVSIILGLLLTFAVSCTPAKKHEFLTFFFDGVPPLYEVNEPSEAEVSDVNAQDEDDLEPSKPVIFIHEPWKNCGDNCHNRTETKHGFRGAGVIGLKASAPELCYECHEKFKDLEGWVHGPVATGACTYCHNPHKSKHKYLLKEAVPELCYQCHRKDEIDLIADHSKESYMQCNDCHVGHASPIKALLKRNNKDR